VHTFSVSAADPDSAILAEAVAILQRGGVIAVATDTLYGLAADPRNDAAVARLFAAKGRDEGVPLPLIAADLDQARAIAAFGETELRLAREFWPGPLTIVAPARAGIARGALAGGATIGIRVPNHAVARALCRAMGSCLTATSANVSGAPAPASAAEIDPTIASRIEAVLDSGPAPGGPPSTIVAASPDGVQLLRAGAIAWERVLESVE
jgi:L-threonylcarbamoyladenylate synthase